MEIRRSSDRVIVVVLAFEQEVLRVICGYAPQCGRPITEKVKFYDEMCTEWDLRGNDELVLGMGDFNGHVGKNIDGFEGVHGRNGIGERNAEGRRLLEFVTKRDYVLQIHGLRK